MPALPQRLPSAAVPWPGCPPFPGCGCPSAASCECPAPAGRGHPADAGRAGRQGPGCDCPPGEARPLPDPAAVRLLAVPDSAPPYDLPRLTPWHDTRMRAAGPNRPRTGDRPAIEPQGAAAGGSGAGGDGDGGPGGNGPGGNGPGGNGPGGNGPGGNGGDEPPPGWPSHFAQVLAETLAGARPPGQLVPWTTDRARDRIQRLGAQLAGGQQPRVRLVRTCRPAADVVEMTVVVGFGPRVRALAVRLERAGPVPARPGRAARAARWLCTDLEAG